jgi:hypothetical protein
MNKRRRYTAKRRRLERHKINERDRKAKADANVMLDPNLAATDEYLLDIETYIYNRSQEINEKLDEQS